MSETAQSTKGAKGTNKGWGKGYNNNFKGKGKERYNFIKGSNTYNHLNHNNNNNNHRNNNNNNNNHRNNEYNDYKKNNDNRKDDKEHYINKGGKDRNERKRSLSRERIKNRYHINNSRSSSPAGKSGESIKSRERSLERKVAEKIVSAPVVLDFSRNKDKSIIVKKDNNNAETDSWNLDTHDDPLQNEIIEESYKNIRSDPSKIIVPKRIVRPVAKYDDSLPLLRNVKGRNDNIYEKGKGRYNNLWNEYKNDNTEGNIIEQRPNKGSHSYPSSPERKGQRPNKGSHSYPSSPERKGQRNNLAEEGSNSRPSSPKKENHYKDNKGDIISTGSLGTDSTNPLLGNNLINPLVALSPTDGSKEKDIISQELEGRLKKENNYTRSDSTRSLYGYNSKEKDTISQESERRRDNNYRDESDKHRYYKKEDDVSQESERRRDNNYSEESDKHRYYKKEDNDRRTPQRENNHTRIDSTRSSYGYNSHKKEELSDKKHDERYIFKRSQDNNREDDEGERSETRESNRKGERSETRDSNRKDDRLIRLRENDHKEESIENIRYKRSHTRDNNNNTISLTEKEEKDKRPLFSREKNKYLDPRDYKSNKSSWPAFPQKKIKSEIEIQPKNIENRTHSPQKKKSEIKIKNIENRTHSSSNSRSDCEVLLQRGQSRSSDYREKEERVSKKQEMDPASESIEYYAGNEDETPQPSESVTDYQTYLENKYPQPETTPLDPHSNQLALTYPQPEDLPEVVPGEPEDSSKLEFAVGAAEHPSSIAEEERDAVHIPKSAVYETRPISTVEEDPHMVLEKDLEAALGLNEHSGSRGSGRRIKKKIAPELIRPLLHEVVRLPPPPEFERKIMQKIALPQIFKDHGFVLNDDPYDELRNYFNTMDPHEVKNIVDQHKKEKIKEQFVQDSQVGFGSVSSLPPTEAITNDKYDNDVLQPPSEMDVDDLLSPLDVKTDKSSRKRTRKRSPDSSRRKSAPKKLKKEPSSQQNIIHSYGPGTSSTAVRLEDNESDSESTDRSTVPPDETETVLPTNLELNTTLCELSKLPMLERWKKLTKDPTRYHFIAWLGCRKYQYQFLDLLDPEATHCEKKSCLSIKHLPVCSRCQVPRDPTSQERRRHEDELYQKLLKIKENFQIGNVPRILNSKSPSFLGRPDEGFDIITRTQNLKQTIKKEKDSKILSLDDILINQAKYHNVHHKFIAPRTISNMEPPRINVCNTSTIDVKHFVILVDRDG